MKINSSLLCILLVNVCMCHSVCENDEIFMDFSIKFCKFRRRSYIDVSSDDILSKERIVQLVKYFNQKNIFAHFSTDDRKNAKPLSIQTTVVKISNLDTLNDMIFKENFLRENKSEWLIYLAQNNITESAHEILERTNIWIETNVFLAYPTSVENVLENCTFSLFKYYKINHKGRNGKVNVSQNLTLDKEWFGIKTRGPISNSDTLINVGICCEVCQYNNFYSSNTNNSEAKDVDKVFKEGLNQLLVSIMTITKTRYTTKCFSKLRGLDSKDENSIFYSIVSNIIDIGFEPMYIDSKELNVIDMSWPVAKTKGYVYYRNKICTPRGKLYSFPFKRKLLLYILIISAICGFAAAVISCLSPRISSVMNKKKRIRPYKSIVVKNFRNLTIGDVFMWFSQPLTSQTGTWFPDSFSGRILSIFFLFFTMIIGQIYSEYISIFFSIQNVCYKSLDQVIKSGDFNLTYIDTISMKSNNMKNDVAESYFETANRVENPEKGFLNVLYGNWAVYIRGKSGREHLGSWKSSEKCYVSESYMPHSSKYLIFPMRKTSLYKNLISYSFTRLYESGVMSKIKRNFYGNLPLCQRNLMSYRASLNDIYPAIYMLVYGALASILICFFEVLWYRHKHT